jgi:hypothetical protein
MKCEIWSDGKDLFVVADDLKVAKLGRPGAPQAETWVLLEPGWAVRDCHTNEGHFIEVEQDGETVQIH